MLITPNNFDKYFSVDRYINVPHRQVFFTLIFHRIAIFLSLVIFYNALACVSVMVLLVEAYYVFSLLFKMWKRSGYSTVLYIVTQTVFFFTDALTAAFVRDYLLELIGL